MSISPLDAWWYLIYNTNAEQVLDLINVLALDHINYWLYSSFYVHLFYYANLLLIFIVY